MKITLLAFMLGTALLTGCGTSAPISTVSHTLAAQKTVSSQQMQQAIYNALQRYGWELQSDNGSQIYARLNKQERHIVDIRIDYSGGGFSIQHAASQGLNHDLSRNNIHRNYNRWVRNLEQDIQSSLSFIQ